jgi:hypothetical protein
MLFTAPGKISQTPTVPTVSIAPGPLRRLHASAISAAAERRRGDRA